jgi:hypothetical protein
MCIRVNPDHAGIGAGLRTIPAPITLFILMIEQHDTIITFIHDLRFTGVYTGRIVTLGAHFGIEIEGKLRKCSIRTRPVKLDPEGSSISPKIQFLSNPRP